MRMIRTICYALVVTCLTLTAMGCGSLHSKPGTTTTVILIRHADSDDRGHLTPEGRARARALVDAAGDMGISAIYSPDLERNIDTVRPLADHTGIDITLTPRVSMPVAGKISKEILTLHAGKVVLWVGNVSGNLQAVYRKMGGKGRGPLEYGQLFVLTIPDKGPTTVVKSTFGFVGTKLAK